MLPEGHASADVALKSRQALAALQPQRFRSVLRLESQVAASLRTGALAFSSF
jgi:hypothetical protein